MADPSPEMLRHGSLRRDRRAPLRLAGRVLPVVSPARVYVCGITPYDVTHLGHAATFVWADAVVRTLRAAGGDVVSCRNVTDVDDVLSKVATERGRFYDELAATQEFLFDRSMRALRVAAPTHAPRAGAHVESVVELAEALVVLGAAYERDGSVYLRGSEVPARAGLDRAAAVEALAAYGDRPDDPHRDDPLDVAVWQSSGAGDPAWPSPWGPGRPGWHAECAAMAVSLLGGQVDVLAGGADLTFPHHAYQSAMVEALTGAAPFARARMPVGHGLHRRPEDGEVDRQPRAGERRAREGRRRRCCGCCCSTGPGGRRGTTTSRCSAPAAQRLERLYVAAGRPGEEAATAGVLARLLDDLDVPGALDEAEEHGGPAARLALRTLALD